MPESTDNAEWEKIKILPAGFVEDLSSIINKIREFSNEITKILKIGLTALKVIGDGLLSKLKELIQLIELLEKLLKDFVDSLTLSGGYSMYMIPSSYSSLERFFTEFKKTLPEQGQLTSLNTSSNAITNKNKDLRYVPNFKKGDYVGGLVILFLGPDYNDFLKMMENFRKIAGLFSLKIPQFLDEFWVNIKWVGWKLETLGITWASIKTKHEIQIIIDETNEAGKVKTTKVKPIMNTEKDITTEYVFNVAKGYKYKITVDAILHGEKGVKTRLKRVEKKFEIPKGNFIDKVKSFGDKEWIGISLDSIFPEIYTIKQWILSQIEFYFNFAKSPLKGTDTLLKRVNKKSEAFLREIEKIEKIFNDFTDKLLALVEVQGYYRKIDYQVGGNQYFIKNVTDKKGIKKAYHQGTVYAGGVFFLFGSPVGSGGETQFSENEQFKKLLDSFFTKDGLNKNIENGKEGFEKAKTQINTKQTGYNENYKKG